MRRQPAVIGIAILLLVMTSWAYVSTRGHKTSRGPTASTAVPVGIVPQPAPSRMPHFYPPGIVPSIEYAPVQATPLAPGATCPASPLGRLPADATGLPTTDNVFGSGPLYIVREAPLPLLDGRPETVVVAVAPGFSGSFMLRGVGVGVPSDIWFGSDPTASPFPILIWNEGAPVSPPQSGIRYLWLMAAAPATSTPGKWRVETLALFAPEPGCYVIQVDGQPPISEQITIEVA